MTVIAYSFVSPACAQVMQESSGVGGGAGLKNQRRGPKHNLLLHLPERESIQCEFWMCDDQLYRGGRGGGTRCACFQNVGVNLKGNTGLATAADLLHQRYSNTKKKKPPTCVKMSLLHKCVNAVPVFETQSTGYLCSLFLSGTWGLFSLSRAALVHCRSCCQSAAQEESIMCDLHLGPKERKVKKEKEAATVLGLRLPQSAVKWHTSWSSCSEAIEPREPVKLQPFRPRLIKVTAIKVRLGSLRLSMCPLCWD